MFCPKCGKQLNDGDTFCAFCGETLNNGGNTEQTFQTTPPPVSYNAQQYPAPSSVPDNTVSAKRPNTAFISAVSAVICLVLIGGFVLFVKPGYLLKRDDDNNSKTNTTTSAVTSESKPAVSTEESEEKPTETTTTAETTAVTTTPTTTSAPETTTTAPETTTLQTTTTSPADKGLEEKNAVYAEAMSLSTGDRPSFDEFEWCFGQGGLVYEAPAGAEMITEPLGYCGGWKAMAIYNPTNLAGTFMRELDNIDIEVNGDSAVIMIDWYLMENDGNERYSEEDMEDSVFFGDVTDSGLYASGDAEISINSLWRENGRQYALGAIITSDGLPAYLAMVRP